MIGPGSDKKGEDIDGGDGSDVGAFFTQLLRASARCPEKCAILCNLMQIRFCANYSND